MRIAPQWFVLLALALAAPAAGCSDNSNLPTADAGVTPYANRRPLLQTPQHALAYVANRQSDSVSVVDLDEFTLVGTAPVGRDPVDLDGPRHFVLDAARGIGYVLFTYPQSNLGPHATSLGSNGRAGYVASYALSDLRPLGEQRINISPGDIAVSDSGGEIAVSHYDTQKGLAADPDARRATIAFIGPAADIGAASVNVKETPVCSVPAALAYVRNDTRVFVACTGEDLVAVVDAQSGEIITRVPAGEANANKPYALVRNQTGDKLLVSNEVARTVVLFSADDTPVVLSTARVESVPFFAEFLSDAEYVVALQDPDGAARIDAASGQVLTTVTYDPEFCLKPSSFRRTADGRLFLVCEGNHHAPGSLVQVDPETLAGNQRLELGIYPERLEVLNP